MIQGWLFYSHRDFWRTPQIKGLRDAVPDDRMIILDLAAEIEPVWKRTGSFYGKQWIWNMLHNFGGNISMFGRIETMAEQPAQVLGDSTSGKLKGIGLTMEGIEQNPVLYELMTDNTWRNAPINLAEWLKAYNLNRYGQENDDLMEAWDILVKTVYNGQTIRDGAESIISARPTFEGCRRWVRTKLNYNPVDLLPAWDHFIKAIPDCEEYDGFQYDLVDVTRRVLANYALPLQQEVAKTYKARDKEAFEKYSRIHRVDPGYGPSASYAKGISSGTMRSWGQTDEEKAICERNARDLINVVGWPG